MRQNIPHVVSLVLVQTVCCLSMYLAVDAAQKRDTPIAEAVSNNLLNRDLEHQPGIDIFSSDEQFDEEGKQQVKFSGWGRTRKPPFMAWDGVKLAVKESSAKVVDGKDGVYSSHAITETDSGSTPTVSSTVVINMEESEGGYGELGSIEKQIKFSNWGGKRTSETVEPLGDPKEVPEVPVVQKRSVHLSPWGSKRQATISQSRTLYSNGESKRG